LSKTGLDVATSRYFWHKSAAQVQNESKVRYVIILRYLQVIKIITLKIASLRLTDPEEANEVLIRVICSFTADQQHIRFFHITLRLCVQV
jgi:hypothetical protein